MAVNVEHQPRRSAPGLCRPDTLRDDDDGLLADEMAALTPEISEDISLGIQA